MLRSVSDLKQFTIATMDGSLGNVSDLYFDDRSWAVRYLVVEAGTWLPSGRVFVPPVSIRSLDSTTLRVALSKKQVTVSSMVNTGDAHLQTATAVMGYATSAHEPASGRSALASGWRLGSRTGPRSPAAQYRRKGLCCSGSSDRDVAEPDHPAPDDEQGQSDPDTGAGRPVQLEVPATEQRVAGE